MGKVIISLSQYHQTIRVFACVEGLFLPSEILLPLILTDKVTTDYNLFVKGLK